MWSIIEILSLIPLKEILNNPSSAWAVIFIVLLVYVIMSSGKREERLQNTIDTTMVKMATSLDGINNNLIRLNDNLCKMEDRIEDIEDQIGLNKEDK